MPPDHLGVAYEDVSFTTSDGLELEGWYVPSRNGAAVIAFPGATDRRSRPGCSPGTATACCSSTAAARAAARASPTPGAGAASKDIKAAIAFLSAGPDVDPGRIGGIGLSVGGELMLETAAETDALAAVVSEGAGARSLHGGHGPGRTAGREVALGVPLTALKTAAIAVFSNQTPPANLKDLVGQIAPRPCS